MMKNVFRIGNLRIKECLDDTLCAMCVMQELVILKFDVSTDW